MPAWEAYLNAHRARFLGETEAFLRIPSVSSLPGHSTDMDRAAQWVARRLEDAGLEKVRFLPVAHGGPPVVYGEWLHAPGRPTILVYGHYDVQPPGDLAHWSHAPFEPVAVAGRLYARGASDDKGNMLLPIFAVEAWLKGDGALPLNVKFLLEGQEEIGSPGLPAFIREHRALLSCDWVVSADGGQLSEEQPAICLGARGLCGLQVDVAGPCADLHSGTFGGAVQNPIHALSTMLASLHRASGRVAVPGFYAKVRAPSHRDRALLRGVPFSEAAFMALAGVGQLAGETGYTVLERVWLRPTVEVNAIWSGSGPNGDQTVLPASAHARLTCRLVPDQIPEEASAAVEAHLRRQAPQGVTVSVHHLPGGAFPYRIPEEHPGNRAAAAVLADVYGRPPCHALMGSSVPVCALFRGILGVNTVTFAFGLDDENIHGPDEFFRLSSWTKGQRAYALLYEHSNLPRSGKGEAQSV